MTDTDERHTEKRSVLTPDELGEMLDCSRHTIHRQIHRGEIPEWVILRFGKKIRFKRDAVARWLAGESS